MPEHLNQYQHGSKNLKYCKKYITQATQSFLNNTVLDSEFVANILIRRVL
jgi:hypothetical protein